MAIAHKVKNHQVNQKGGLTVKEKLTDLLQLFKSVVDESKKVKSPEGILE